MLVVIKQNVIMLSVVVPWELVGYLGYDTR
jgi:hypothetical protein